MKASTDTTAAKNNDSNRPVMFHDGECPLCRFEVKTMQKLDTANAIHWVDITKDKAALEQAGISNEQAMARIHVISADQQMLTGVKGFLAVWEKLPYYRTLARIIQAVPLLLPILEFFYSIFAKYRLPLTGKKPIHQKSELSDKAGSHE